MRLACLTVFAGAVAFAAPAKAQSFEEAVWANASLALQLCVSGQVPPQARANWFRDAGFAETVTRDRSNSDTVHTFAAPADTVPVELYYGEMPEHCTVTSVHMGVTQGGALLDALIPQLFPGFVRKVQTVTGGQCVSFEDPANPIGLVIGVTASGDQGCVEDGTVRFYSSYRV